MANNRRQQVGFTLIEVMVVVIIIAILAAIAIPSYRRYVIKNAEDDAKAQMLNIALQLDQWRASQLSYKDFYPKNVDSSGDVEYKYDANNKTINVPLGSTGNAVRYTITLVDNAAPANSLVSSGLNPTAARSWKMLATPNTNGIVGNQGHAFIMTSTGSKCYKIATTSSMPDITNKCTETGWEVW